MVVGISLADSHLIYAVSNSNPPNLCMRAEMKPLIHATGESATKELEERCPVKGDADEDLLAKPWVLPLSYRSGSPHRGTLGGTTLLSQN